MSWDERNSFEGSDQPGRYLLTHCDRMPSGCANPLEKNVIYIGETCSNRLKGSDRGKDIIASPDGLGLEEPRILTEVKHRQGQMGSQEVRSFWGGLRRLIYLNRWVLERGKIRS